MRRLTKAEAIRYRAMTLSFKVGDPAPRGYVQWHEWAEVQSKGGLRQKRCRWRRWHFPQEECRHGLSVTPEATAQ